MSINVANNTNAVTVTLLRLKQNIEIKYFQNFEKCPVTVLIRKHFNE